MELSKKNEEYKLINTELGDISGKNNDQYEVYDNRKSSIIYYKIKKSRFNIKDIPFVIYPMISSPYTGLQQFARFTFTLSIPLTMISASIDFGLTLTCLGALSSSSL